LLQQFYPIASVTASHFATGDHAEMSLDEAPCRLPSVLAMPKVVRDLLWTVTSPHMLSGDRFPVLPAEFGVQALKSDAAIDWVNALVADPTPLVTFVEGKGRTVR
jgi:hypothetical protein